MKILMVNKFLYPRGGAESYMLKLGEALTLAGHEVEYFGMADEKNTVGNRLGLTTGNMDFHGKGIARFLYPFRILYSLETRRKMEKVLDAFQPDVVHMNNINFQLTPSFYGAVKKRGIPLIQTVHDYQMVCPNHLFYSFEEKVNCTRCLNASKWHCMRHRCIHGSLVKSILGVMEAYLHRLLGSYRKVDCYLCPSSFLEQKLLAENSFYRGKTRVIHNFIEKSEIPHLDPNRHPYVVFVGRLSAEKGVRLLAEAARLLPEVRFLVAGNGPDGAELEGMENVSLLGFVSGKDLTCLMAGATLLVAPSVCFENCPLSILESHALGVPVVTMNYGGMAELVEDGKTGTLVKEPTAEALADAIRRTLSDPKQYEIMKEHCRERSEQILTAEEYTALVIEEYQKWMNA